MTREEALDRLKVILGKGLCPTLISDVEAVLGELEQDSFEAGYEHATETVSDWYDPKPPGY